MNKCLYMVIPCYNEEEVIESTIKILTNKIKLLIKSKKIDKNSKIVIVDDGSSDKTLEIVKKLKNKIQLSIQLHCKYITLFDISMQYKENKNTKNENYFYNLFLLEAISSRIPTK